MDTELNISEKHGFSPRRFLKSIQNKIASSKYSYLAFCFAVPTVIMYIVYICMGIHPFADGSVLVLDLNAQYVYFYEALRNTVFGDGSMLYTFFRGLGGEFVGMYAYYLASPLSYIVALFPQQYMLDALLAIILIKTGLCGLTFGLYLHKNSKNHNKFAILIFSVMYALCAYAVVYQNNIMWMDALIWLPMITLGIEQLVKNRKYKLFVVALSMSIMSNYYIGYMTCFFVMIYYFYYILSKEKDELNPHNLKLPRLHSFIRIAVFSLLSVGIAAFIILGAYYSLTFGKNEFSNPNWSFKAKFEILDFLTKFLPGTYDTVRPDGLPYVYCGVLTLILVPVYFISKKIRSREKIASLIFIAVFVFSFIASPLDLIWHGFQNPNWLNYRYSFMLCFFLLVLAYKAFGNLHSVSEKFLLGVSAFLILFVTVCDKLEFKTYIETESKIQDLQTVWLTVIAAIAILAVLCLILRQKNPLKRKNLSSVLAIIVCIEVFASSIACVAMHQADVGGYQYTAGYKNYTEFMSGIRPIIEEVESKDDGFYRMEKLVHRRVNDNMALGIRGLSNSTSTLNSETITFLKLMGYSARSHRSIYYGGNPVNDSLLGVKYIVDYNTSKTLDTLYEEFASTDKYTAYINDNALSIAYGVDSSIAEFDMTAYGTHFRRLNELVKTMLGDTEYPDVFVPVRNATISTSVVGCTESKNYKSVTYTPNKESASNHVTFTFNAPTSSEYYFHTPSTTSNETVIYVNGMKISNYLGADTNNIIYLGRHEAGDEVTVKIELNDKPITIYSMQTYNYIWALDEVSFNDAFNKLKANPQFNITEYTEDNLIGNITTTNANQTIQTTIPYDEGWKIYVDGQEVKTYKTLNALIAFDIEAVGEHTLEMKYSPKIYKLGITVSIASAAIFLILCILDIIFYFVYIRKKKSKSFSDLGEKWVLEDFERDDAEIAALPEVKAITFKEKLLSKIQKKKSRDQGETKDINEGDD